MAHDKCVFFPVTLPRHATTKSYQQLSSLRFYDFTLQQMSSPCDRTLVTLLELNHLCYYVVLGLNLTTLTRAHHPHNEQIPQS